MGDLRDDLVRAMVGTFVVGIVVGVVLCKLGELAWWAIRHLHWSWS